MNQQDFIGEVAPMAMVIMEHHGISAALQIAQACLESGFGAHAPGNNLFGVKADKAWHGDVQLLWTHEWDPVKQVLVPTQAPFRVYKSLSDSIDDHAKFLLYVKPGERNRYANLVNAKWQDACHLIVQDHYATDPLYCNKLLSIIRMYHLDKYDTQVLGELG